MKDEAILVVSFGSSYEETRRKTIDKIEEEIKAAFPEFAHYSAFTSERIRQKLQQEKLSISMALEKMISEKVKKVYIQPTFIIEGVQYKQMAEEAEHYKDCFERMVFGNPLLTSIKDYQTAIKVFASEHETLSEDKAVICMGHGADEHLSVSFAALDYMFKDAGYENYYVATIRSYPAITHVIKQLKKKGYRKVFIYPFMVVAGYHAHQDILGKAEQAWKRLLENEGYEVESQLIGLGEYEGIRHMYVRHVQDMIDKK